MGDPPPLKLKREGPAGSTFDTVQPNPEFTEMLVGMGFPLNLAQVSLFFFAYTETPNSFVLFFDNRAFAPLPLVADDIRLGSVR